MLIYNHMVVDKVSDEAVDRLFHALADATRRDILRHAMAGEHSVSALARRYPMSLPAVQKHVRVLADAGLVAKVRRGREQRVHTDVEAIRSVARLLDEYEALWRGRIDRIGDLLADGGQPPEEIDQPEGMTP
ncbi:MAG: metalloregulator ArsR/SmtB family transcription factor [Acidimicrobiales bacterium]